MSSISSISSSSTIPAASSQKFDAKERIEAFEKKAEAEVENFSKEEQEEAKRLIRIFKNLLSEKNEEFKKSGLSALAAEKEIEALIFS